MQKNRLAIVVPCYNEQEVFPLCAEKLTEVIKDLIIKQKVAKNSFILFVDDGSKDKTWELISGEAAKNKYVRGLKLSGNVGHQNALLAGLVTANDSSDMTVSIDADLQDDVTAIEKMVDKYLDGFDVVYGVRNDRSSDSVFKRTTAQGFYKLMSTLGAKSVYNHADFRLMSHRAVESLKKYKERNLFLRGIVPLIGFKSDTLTRPPLFCFAHNIRYPT